MKANLKKLIKNRKVKKKEMGLQRFINSFINSFNGLKYAYTHEQSLLIHILYTIIVIMSGIYFKLSGTHWILVLFAIAMVVVTELLNTAIEAVVDLVTEEYHPLAKVAKDCASAAVFVVTLISASIWLYVFLPKIYTLFF